MKILDVGLLHVRKEMKNKMKSWYCDKCQSNKVVNTQKGVKCAICGGKVYLAEKVSYHVNSSNLLFNPKTKMIRIKDFVSTCPSCGTKYKFTIDFSIAKLKGFFKEEGN